MKIPLPFASLGRVLHLIILGGIVLGSVLLAAGPGGVAAGPTDTITVSLATSTIAESDDYATQVLGDPWDMNNPDDVDWMPGMSPPTYSNGIMSSQQTVATPEIFLQSHGQLDSMTYMNEDDGNNYPIDSSRYRRLQIRMFNPVITLNAISVFWYSTKGVYTGPGRSNWKVAQGGWGIYDIDLLAIGDGGTGNWTAGNWKGLRVDPNNRAAAGQQVQIDWARLVPANTGRSLTINWTQIGSNSVNLYLDTDTNSANGTDMQIAASLDGASTSYTWNNIGIAPGTYYIRAEKAGSESYSGPLVVNQTPVLDLLAPGPASGEDFASTVLGSPWAMNSSTDLQHTLNLATTAYNTYGLRASATNGDPQLFYLNNDTTHTVDSSKYRYFNYNMYVARPAPTNGQYDYWNGGPRALWAPLQVPGQPVDWQSTLVLLAWYDRWMNVVIDMKTTPVQQSTVGWNGGVNTFRFDPHEEADVVGGALLPPYFELGQVRLTADPTVASGAVTTIYWKPMKTTGNVSLTYSATPNGAGTPIATVPLANGGYRWLTTGVPAGTYWIKATADDGLNTFTQVSQVPLVVAGTRGCQSSFSDVPPGSTFYTFVQDLYCQKMIDGYSDNTFRWYADASRGQLAEWVVRAKDLTFDLAGGPHLADVPVTDPLYPYIETAYARGIISGYTCGGPGEPCDAQNRNYFRPYNNLTRGQMSKMITLAFGWNISTNVGTFVDVPQGAPFYDLIETLFAKGAVNGYSDGTFRPNAPLTRGQLSKVLSLALDAPAP